MQSAPHAVWVPATIWECLICDRTRPLVRNDPRSTWRAPATRGWRVNDEAVAALSPHGDLAGPGADLTDPVAVDRLRDILTEEHADATLLVNAAGVCPHRPARSER